MTSLENKVVWITGASSGIGEALAKVINKKGGIVILSSRREVELKRVQMELDRPENSMVLPLDLLQHEQFVPATKAILDEYSRIDVLVNNGGISQRSLARETPLDLDRKIMELNYFSHVALTKTVLPIMTNQKGGNIVTISSLSGKFGFFLRSAYAASKHALQGFFETLRLEEEVDGIKVLLVYPGLIKTNISQNALDAKGNPHGKLDNNQAQGISAEKCAEQIVKGIEKDKLEIFPGGKEKNAVKIKRFSPRLFYKIIRKQSPE